MSDMVTVVSYGIGTVLGILVFWFIEDITQKKHTVLRNYPVIGRLRYLLEKQGEYFRQYFFMNDREELPFNRSTRGWVYRLAKDEDRLPTPPLTIGEGFCKTPFEARSIVNISGMSFGAISEPAVRALSRGAK